MDVRAKSDPYRMSDEDLLIQHGPVDVSELRAALQASPDFCRESSQGDNAKLTGQFDWLVDVPWDEALTAKTTHEFMSNLMISDPDTALVGTSGVRV